MTDKCKLDAEKMTNQGFTDMGKLRSQRSTVAGFNPHWAYAHHAYIAFYKGNGILRGRVERSMKMTSDSVFCMPFQRML